ncbi:Ig-like domain-containing protein [Streptomyces fragilis]|uniref:Ig-like domain-containing protein n=1 Tax=Streptomyces fragilis TaxID=67301 RepID=A0ABV2YPZ9_9ACTN|nr:Ig-like domain-containing protein [Streptomyces fragilis]
MTTPTAGYHCVKRFTSTGKVQDFRVPDKVTSLDVRMWGSGGGGGLGGGGGFTSGVVTVTPGEVLKVVVGSLTFGGGAKRGGGLSGLYRSADTPLLIAGGGGAGNNGSLAGGPGGGTRGGDGAGRHEGYSGKAARGASSAKGGAGAACNAKNGGGAGGDLGKPGGSGGGVLPKPKMGGGGGNAYASDYHGGGGGYAGGGGGGGVEGNKNAYASGGGGGSGFVATSGVSGGKTVAGSGAKAAGKSDPLYESGVGDADKAGQVVLQWRLPAGVLNAVAGEDEIADQEETFAGPLTVKARAADGKTLITGTPVTFTVTQGDATFSGGSTSATATTGADGTATAPAVVAGTAVGPVKVTAQADTAQVVFSLEVVPAFELAPGGPPDVNLRGGGGVGYPGLRVLTDKVIGPLPLQRIEASLSAGVDLRWGTAAAPDHQLTVIGGETYPGTLSDDGMTLVFDDVDLAKAPGTEKTVYVAAGAGHDAPLATTAVTFTVGRKTSPSTPVVIQPAFSLAPGGIPVDLARDGAAVRYPGVEVVNNGAQDIPARTITVTAPAGLRFGTTGNPDHQLTVMDSSTTMVSHFGDLSGDGQTLTFTDVSLPIPNDQDRANLWVCVSADPTTPLGPTGVDFTVGPYMTSQSTIVNIV